MRRTAPVWTPPQQRLRRAPPLAERFRAVRRQTEALVAGLTPEDCQLQSMPDASPVKWHLAHATWFFETFVLAPRPGYRPFDPAFRHLFNSYYHAVGPQPSRPARGLLSRPDLARVFAWRAHVDAALAPLLRDALPEATRSRVELGLQHEQQHQELILTDLKHALSLNPLQPAMRAGPLPRQPPAPAHAWLSQPAGFAAIGHAGAAFAYDNEQPQHRVWLEGFRIGSRWITNAEYRAFIDAGGYTTPALWLAEGWDRVQSERWERPLYWSADGACQFTLRGPVELDPHEPVCHVSYFEADAFARWAGARLPREQEWERVAGTQPAAGQFLESGDWQPRLPATPAWLGSVWIWTQSAYGPYPGFRPLPGELGEYNGKFMSGQFVLRGGSCATPASHARTSYRNFFPPRARWQFSGIRLAQDGT